MTLKNGSASAAFVSFTWWDRLDRVTLYIFGSMVLLAVGGLLIHVVGAGR